MKTILQACRSLSILIWNVKRLLLAEGSACIQETYKNSDVPKPYRYGRIILGKNVIPYMLNSVTYVCGARARSTFELRGNSNVFELYSIKDFAAGMFILFDELIY